MLGVTVGRLRRAKELSEVGLVFREVGLLLLTLPRSLAHLTRGALNAGVRKLGRSTQCTLQVLDAVLGTRRARVAAGRTRVGIGIGSAVVAAITISVAVVAVAIAVHALIVCRNLRVVPLPRDAAVAEQATSAAVAVVSAGGAGLCSTLTEPSR